jgi:hypothetical protein
LKKKKKKRKKKETKLSFREIKTEQKGYVGNIKRFKIEHSAMCLQSKRYWDDVYKIQITIKAILGGCLQSKQTSKH